MILQFQNKLLSDLVEEGLLVPQGHGRGTIYILSDVFIEEAQDNKENNLGNNEKNLGNNEKNLGNNEEILGNNNKNLGNNNKNLGNNSDNLGSNNEDHKNLMEIARPAREKKRLKPEILRSLIL